VLFVSNILDLLLGLIILLPYRKQALFFNAVLLFSLLLGDLLFKPCNLEVLGLLNLFSFVLESFVLLFFKFFLDLLVDKF